MTARERERARAGVFFDTNVLVYAEDPRDETKSTELASSFGTRF